MRLVALGFLVGVLLCQSLTGLPPKSVFVFIVIILPVLIVPISILFPRYRFLTSMTAGFMYSLVIAHNKLADQLPVALEGVDLKITGTVVSLPREFPDRTSFQFAVSDFSEFNTNVNKDHSVNAANAIVTQSSPLGQKILLNWYSSQHRPRVGEQWQFIVRLKRPSGFSNPGGFDYERWLFQQDIIAKGYVASKPAWVSYSHILSSGPTFSQRVNRWRAKILERLNQLLPDSPHRALLSALVVGERQALTDQQWRVLSATGTNHLMAISGLHIGLIAGLGFFAGARLWRLIPKAPLSLPAPKAGAVCALVVAAIYAAMAGFSIPTQRALIMVIVVMIAVWRQMTFNPSQVLAVALLLVLLFDPMAVSDAGFWLSFIAVAIIFYGMGGRLVNRHWWWKWGRVQWIIALGLAPLLVFFFQQIPLLSPLANIVAVPVVSLLTVPFSLLGSLSALLFPEIARPILYIADTSLHWLWPMLDWMASQDGLLLQTVKPAMWLLIPAAIGVTLLLAPLGWPARWLGVIWLVPLVLVGQSPLAKGGMALTLLDVGQGLSAVIRTRNHVMVYDTGPRFGDSFDAARVALIPYLHQQGIDHIDTLVLSHDDIDHVGGTQSLLEKVAVSRIIGSPGVSANQAVQSCHLGLGWEWDGVQFEILHPNLHSIMPDDNNRSCVVRISAGGGRILITGDIEKTVESRLLTDNVFDVKSVSHTPLNADILVVPHHGSLSSSSERFVHAVSPRFALISAGYRNRYGLPKPEVVDRYRAVGATVMSTQEQGAIQAVLDNRGQITINGHREDAGRYWSRRGP